LRAAATDVYSLFVRLMYNNQLTQLSDGLFSGLTGLQQL
jgi:hypothetical protein